MFRLNLDIYLLILKRFLHQLELKFLLDENPKLEQYQIFPNSDLICFSPVSFHKFHRKSHYSNWCLSFYQLNYYSVKILQFHKEHLQLLPAFKEYVLSSFEPFLGHLTDHLNIFIKDI